MTDQRIKQLEDQNKRLVEENNKYQQQLTYFQLLMDTLPDHIYFKDKQSRFITVSKSQAKDILGENSAEKLIGLTDFDLFDDDHAKNAYEDEQRIIRTGEGIVNKEEKETYPNGKIYWASTTKLPIYDSEGNITGVFGLSRNITKLKQLLNEVEKLSEHDQLTGLLNKRMFNAHFAREWLTSRRNHWDLSLLMIDIDFFKQYNDHYGHLSGDQCLTQIANAIQEVPNRPGDYACRFGGEEFVVILQNTPTTGAIHIAEQIMLRIKELAIPHKHSKVSDNVTVSIGISTISLQLKKTDCDKNKLINCADQALYSAKRTGRNTYCIQNPEPSPCLEK